MALFAGADGMAAYARIAAQLGRLLAPGGIAILESGKSQARAIAALCSVQGLELIGIRDDLGAAARSVAVRS
jgi:release factor glutamine methyltransferase